MKLHCIDKTAGELSLLPALWQTLRGHSGGFNLYTANNYGGLTGFFKPDLLQKAVPRPRKEDVYLYLISRAEDLAEVPSGALCFPILPRRLAQEYCERSQGDVLRYIPLAAEQSLESYVHGDLLSLQDLLERLRARLFLKGLRVLISAGPTAEDLDPVRYLTNRSTGKMGLALARAAFIHGAQVHLVLGATGLQVPPYLSLSRVRSAAQMAEDIFKRFPENDVYVGAAAIADFTPLTAAKDKIKKKPGNLQLTLKRTPDVIKELGRRKKEQFIVGFSVETGNEIENSLKKLKSKNMDMIVVNNPKQPGAAFAADTNRVTIIYADGQKEELALMSKLQVSTVLWERIAQRLKVKK